MALTAGDKAPNFTLPTKTADGPKLITLSDSFGVQHTVLLFFPMAFTGACTQEMCSVSQSMARYAGLNATVLGISGDNPFAQEAWAQKEGISFPLLSDYEHEVSRTYGVAYDQFLPQLNLPMGGVAKRAAFVVDKLGVIQHVEVLEDARELPNFDAIVHRLQNLV
jgi:peroxiredoxin